MTPLARWAGRAALEGIAADVDGTLTAAARLTPRLLRALERLERAGVELIPVSGRSSGEVLALARYLPGVRRAIAENGLVEVVPDRACRPLAPRLARAELLGRAQALLTEAGLALKPAPDLELRLADVAFERGTAAPAALDRVVALAPGRGLFATWSSVHLHVAAAPLDKGLGLLTVLGATQAHPERWVTIGDAPNDVGLFVPGRFGLTVGTADLRAHADRLTALPQFVTRGREVGGFLELTAAVLGAGARAASGRG